MATEPAGRHIPPVSSYSFKVLGFVTQLPGVKFRAFVSVLQSSEVMEISEGEYHAGMMAKATTKPVTVQPVSAQPAAVQPADPQPKPAPSAEPASAQ